MTEGKGEGDAHRVRTAGQTTREDINGEEMAAVHGAGDDENGALEASWGDGEVEGLHLDLRMMEG